MRSRRARCARLSIVAALGLVLPAALPAAEAQDLGHRVLGTVGLDAGRVPPPGLHIADRVVFYTAGQLNDRTGSAIAGLGLDLDAFADALGVAYTLELPHIRTSLTVAAAAPLVHVSLGTTAPVRNLDKVGLADVFIEPVALGWRLSDVDLVARYDVYLPTRRFQLMGKGVSSGQITHQFALGGQVAFDPGRRLFLAALASYDLSGTKWGLDLTRGDTIQVQGGVGLRIGRAVELGVAGYGQWQVRDDRGADLPAVLRGARDRAVGIGPEAAVSIRALRAAVRVRCEWDVAAASRPQGRIILMGLTFTAWRPKAPEQPAAQDRRP